MKSFALALVMASFSVQAAEVLSAKLDASRENILVDVKYGGGCKIHKFSLELGECLESHPVQCEARLVETVEDGEDLCRAMVTETAVFNLKEYGLTDLYYSKASLTITGERGFTGIPSSATVELP